MKNEFIAELIKFGHSLYHEPVTIEITRSNKGGLFVTFAPRDFNPTNPLSSCTPMTMQITEGF